MRIRLYILNMLHGFTAMICAILCTLLTTGCSPDESRPTLTVSIEPQRYLLEQIAGGRWHVNTMLDKNSDPENFDPTMSVMKSAMKSRAYFRIGDMAFENAIIGRLSENNPDMTIVDTSKGIEPILGTHSTSDRHESHRHNADPHTWCSVRNARIMAANMRDAMIAIDPENADFYTANFNRLDSKLDSLDNILAQQLAPHAGQTFLMWHPSLSYFARDYHLRQLPIGSENKELSARGLKEKISEARQHDVMLFIIQPNVDSDRATDVADQTGSRTISVNLNSYDWLTDLTHVAKAIAETE